MKVKKWGNSLGIRIPASLARELDLRPDSEVELKLEDGKLVLYPVKRVRLEDLVSRITPENLHPETSWGDRRGREDW